MIQPDRSGLLHRAQQRVLVHAREFVDLGHFGFGNLAAVDAADAAPPRMDMQHHLGGTLQLQVEELLQHGHHEVHRGVVIIQQEHLVARRWRHLGLAGLNH